MKSQSHLFPIILMARLLRVSVSRFYDWLKRGMSKRSIQRNQQTILVKINTISLFLGLFKSRIM